MISETGWTTFHIGLIVTGNVEEQSIAKPLNRLFSKLCDEQDPPRCNVVFQVIRKIGQLTPRSKGHVSRELFMPGPGRKRIPTKDEELISLPARAFLSKHSGPGVESFVILLDDLERRELGQAFKRYREAFDVPNPNARDQFCVHFLVNMVEAYFLADPNHQSEVESRSKNLNPRPTSKRSPIPRIF